MIPQNHLTEWRTTTAPWADDAQVEQDLVLSRAVVNIFSDPFLRETLAFRGGTVLHKCHLAPAARYSNDIDLVMTIADKIGPVFNQLRVVLGWIGTRADQAVDQPRNYHVHVSDDIGHAIAHESEGGNQQPRTRSRVWVSPHAL